MAIPVNITLKTLRAVMNRAIKEHEASSRTYPFGKNGFEIGLFGGGNRETLFTAKGFGTFKEFAPNEFCLGACPYAVLFFLYYCYGMSFVDMAKLTTENIVVSEGIDILFINGKKTKNVKNMKPLIIPVTGPALKDILEWFKQNTSLVGDYLCL